MAGVITFADVRHPMHRRVKANRSRTLPIGTRIIAAIASTETHNTLCGKLRNYLRSLNQPQRHDADAITDRLTELLQFECVKNVRRPVKVPVTRETVSVIVAQAIADEGAENPVPVRQDTVPPVSDVGTRLQRALIDSFTQPGDEPYRFSCGSCVAFLYSLNLTTNHDADTVTDGLLVTLQMPSWKREIVGDTRAQRVWLRAIVADVIASTGPS